MKLYDSKLAPNPRRVRIFMAEKGVTCDNQQVDIMKGENLSEDFLAVSPRGLLPTLVLDDGTAIDESVAICRYLEETHPEPRLMGTDPVSKAHVEARAAPHGNSTGSCPRRRPSATPSPGSRRAGWAVTWAPSMPFPNLRRAGRRPWADSTQRWTSISRTRGTWPATPSRLRTSPALCTVDFASGAARSPVPDECANVKRWYAEVSARPSAGA